MIIVCDSSQLDDLSQGEDTTCKTFTIVEVSHHSLHTLHLVKEYHKLNI